MRNWFHVIPKNSGLSTYVWIIFCILPFYFIMRSLSLRDVTFGILLILLFFIAYRLSYNSKNGFVYLWVSIEMAINIFMTVYFSYVYFGLFLAFFIGKVKSKSGFLTMYIVHLSTTIASITVGFFIETPLFTSQLPFVLVSVIGVILLPFNMYNRDKRELLEGQLEDANKKLSQLVIMEERQRIARDLHDTLGQKLSLIGLKSDLARKILNSDPNSAKMELDDINQTARTALKEVREMVSNMRAIKLTEEVIKITQILEAAKIKVIIDGDPKLDNIPSIVENVVCMCLKEAVTNVVKHSNSTICHIKIIQLTNEIIVEVHDNGIGLSNEFVTLNGHGLAGMRERLEFVNGSLDTLASEGTLIKIRVPNVVQQTKKGESL